MTSNFFPYGEELYVLAEIDDGGLLQIALGTKSGKVYKGFEKENCILEKQKNGYYKVMFKRHSLNELRSKPISLHFFFKKTKVYAFAGDIECQMLKY